MPRILILFVLILPFLDAMLSKSSIIRRMHELPDDELIDFSKLDDGSYDFNKIGESLSGIEGREMKRRYTDLLWKMIVDTTTAERKDENIQTFNWIFQLHNPRSRYEQRKFIDLHGLSLKEAQDRLENFLKSEVTLDAYKRRYCPAKNVFEAQVHVISGKGLHSEGGKSSIKNWIYETCVISERGCFKGWSFRPETVTSADADFGSFYAELISAPECPPAHKKEIELDPDSDPLRHLVSPAKALLAVDTGELSFGAAGGASFVSPKRRDKILKRTPRHRGKLSPEASDSDLTPTKRLTSAGDLIYTPGRVEVNELAKYIVDPKERNLRGCLNMYKNLYDSLNPTQPDPYPGKGPIMTFDRSVYSNVIVLTGIHPKVAREKLEEFKSSVLNYYPDYYIVIRPEPVKAVIAVFVECSFSLENYESFAHFTEELQEECPRVNPFGQELRRYHDFKNDVVYLKCSPVDEVAASGVSKRIDFN